MMVDEIENNNNNEPITDTKDVVVNGDNKVLVNGSYGEEVEVEEEEEEGSSADGVRIYKRRKRRKIASNSDQTVKTKFDYSIEAVHGSASDQDLRRLSFEAFSNGPGECSLTHCGKAALQQMHRSLNGCENGLGGCIQKSLVTHPESGCTSVLKESLDSAERSDDNTHSSAKEHSHRESEGSTISELCGRAFSDIINSDKYSELSGLLLKNFGVVNANQVLDLNAINLKMNNGAYETSPMLYLKDIQRVWTKLHQVGNEMVALAKSLSDASRANYEQFFRKPRGAEGCSCQGCGKKADLRNCLVCDSCEEIYHLSCTELGNNGIPPKNWYCASCVSNGIGSPHDNCSVCEKLKAAASVSLADEVLTNGQSHVPDGLEEDMHDVIDESLSLKICFICKSEVKIGENYRTCGHALCEHKFYHYRCLTYKQLGVSGPCWYCPSCLCRRCLVDKDDDQIVLCDGCDQAYHIYCASPQLNSIPKGSWFCGKCDRELKRIRTMKRVYENLQKKVKIEDGSENTESKAVAVVDEHEGKDKSGGLDMLVTAAKTISHQETLDTLRIMNGNT